MKRNLVLIAGFLGIVGLIMSIAGDLGNLYGVKISGVHVLSHTLALLWLISVILIFVGLFVGDRKAEKVL